MKKSKPSTSTLALVELARRTANGERHALRNLRRLLRKQARKLQTHAA